MKPLALCSTPKKSEMGINISNVAEPPFGSHRSMDFDAFLIYMRFGAGEKDFDRAYTRYSGFGCSPREAGRASKAKNKVATTWQKRM